MPSEPGTKTDPSTFLSDIIGKQVVVKLSNAIEYTGDLQTIDGYMNVVLENGKEYVNGNKCRDYGDVFIRGNNVKPKDGESVVNKVEYTGKHIGTTVVVTVGITNAV